MLYKQAIGRIEVMDKSEILQKTNYKLESELPKK
jgi:hypothetical protein